MWRGDLENTQLHRVDDPQQRLEQQHNTDQLTDWLGSWLGPQGGQGLFFIIPHLYIYYWALHSFFKAPEGKPDQANCINTVRRNR
jgi:hypothetical protein